MIKIKFSIIIKVLGQSLIPNLLLVLCETITAKGTGSPVELHILTPHFHGIFLCAAGFLRLTV